MLPMEMNTFLILGMATMLTLTLVAAITTTTAAFADRTFGESTADANVHNTPGDFEGLQDRSFHEGDLSGRKYWCSL